MSRDPHDHSTRFSRRTLLTRVAVIGAGAVVSRRTLAAQTRPAPSESAAGGATSPSREREPLETFTPTEAAIVEAIAARLIPSDGNGPGAADARAARYIDRALGGALAAFRETYRSGLSATDANARASKGKPFAQLNAADQDAILADMEANAATGFTPDSRTFFDLVRTHTIQGTFSDPFYGGNAGFVGWDLIGYPGVRLAAAAEDQRLDRRPATVRRSAYDHAMFSKKRPREPASRVRGNGR
jgi:gluconate 2-dehydrogenase gamma chain